MRRSRIPTRGHHRPLRGVALRERLLRDEAARDPLGLLVRLRRELDVEILHQKREVVARDLDRDRVLAVVVNPRLEPSSGWIAVVFETIPRDEVVAHSAGPELAELRASLAAPPKPGHVWVFIPIPGQRLLVEEPVEHRVTDLVVAAEGGSA